MLIFIINRTCSFSQNKLDTFKQNQERNNYKPEILNNGFIDVVGNGQINASARFLRLYIGEPKKFSIPLSLYSGVSANNFQNSQSQPNNKNNEHLYNNFINPLSGLVNICIEDVYFQKKKQNKITWVSIIYNTGLRILTGNKVGLITNPSTGKPVNFINSFASSGLYFQTGAWERNNQSNLGIFWAAFRLIGSYSNPNQLKDIVPDIKTNGLYYGYSFGWGVEINSLVNLKVIFYKYLKQPEFDFTTPIYQFSFNYSLKN